MWYSKLSTVTTTVLKMNTLEAGHGNRLTSGHRHVGYVFFVGPWSITTHDGVTDDLATYFMRKRL